MVVVLIFYSFFMAQIDFPKLLDKFLDTIPSSSGRVYSRNYSRDAIFRLIQKHKGGTATVDEIFSDVDSALRSADILGGGVSSSEEKRVLKELIQRSKDGYSL